MQGYETSPPHLLTIGHRSSYTDVTPHCGEQSAYAPPPKYLSAYLSQKLWNRLASAASCMSSLVSLLEIFRDRRCGASSSILVLNSKVGFVGDLATLATELMHSTTPLRRVLAET